MARQLCCGRRLLLHTWQGWVNTSPTRRTGCPDGHCRLGKIRIVERPGPNKDQMRSCLSLAEEWSAAIWAEPAVHSTTAVRHTREVTRLPHDLERQGAKASAYRSTARSQILAIAAPTHPRSDRRLRALPANCTAKAPACHRHFALQGQERGNAASQIVPLPAAQLQQCRLTLLCSGPAAAGCASLRGRLRSNVRRHGRLPCSESASPTFALTRRSPSRLAPGARSTRRRGPRDLSPRND
jgi:hypothetical protein